MNLTDLYDEVTDLVDEERAEDVTGFGNSFNTVSHHIIIDKLMEWDLNK